MFLVNLIQNEVLEELICILTLKTKLIEENTNEKSFSISAHIEIPKVYSSSVITIPLDNINIQKF